MEEALDGKRAPEMETNHVTQQVGLSRGSGAQGLSPPRPPSFTLLSDVSWDNRKQRRKGSPQKGSRMEQQPLIPAPCRQTAQRTQPELSNAARRHSYWILEVQVHSETGELAAEWRFVGRCA